MANDLNKLFGKEEHTLVMYFDGYDKHEFSKWSQFRKYISEEYTDIYVEKLLETEGVLEDNCIYFRFISNRVNCAIEVYMS